MEFPKKYIETLRLWKKFIEKCSQKHLLGCENVKARQRENLNWNAVAVENGANPDELLNLEWPFSWSNGSGPLYSQVGQTLDVGKWKKVCWSEICMNWQMSWCKGGRKNKNQGLGTPRQYLEMQWETWFRGGDDNFHWGHTGTFLVFCNAITGIVPMGL